MADDPLHLGDECADVLRPFGNLNVQQLLHGPDVSIVVGHRTDVIEPIRVRDDLHVGQALGEFLHSPVQIPEVGRGLHDPLPVQREHDSNHAVCAGVLGPHVQQQLFLAVGRGNRARVGREDLPLCLGYFSVRGPTLLVVHVRKKLEPAPPSLPLRREVFP